MSTTGSAIPGPTTLGNAIEDVAGKAQSSQGVTLNTFFASLAGSIVAFAIQLLAFLFIKDRLARIYAPKTYLVPERERIRAPPTGLWRWIVPVFRTSNSDFIQKCGLDAYFFLRYLRTLLKIFVPLSLLILPILIPINLVHGRGSHFTVGRYSNTTSYSNVTGLDQLGWGNVRPDQTSRYWAHLILAVILVVYVCYTFFDELRGYIRLRQAYLTSPQHRLRASATTVLISAIPRKWCTIAALDGLYDVYPGGIRNIWINRNFDELSFKVEQRNKLALKLEAAETTLIKNVKKAHTKQAAAAAKKAGATKKERKRQTMIAEKVGKDLAESGGVSAGNPHQVAHTVQEALHEGSGNSSRSDSQDRGRRRPFIPVPVIGQGLDALGHGIGGIGKTVFGGIKRVGREVDGRLNLNGGPRPVEGDGPTSVEHNIDGVAPDATPSRNGAGYVSMDGPADDDDGHPSRRTESNELTVAPTHSREEAISRPSQIGLNRQDVNSGTPNTPVSASGRATDSRLGETFNDTGRASRHLTAHNGSDENQPNAGWMFWKKGQRGHTLDIPSPVPHGAEEDEFPLGNPSPVTPGANPPATVNGRGEAHHTSHGKKKLRLPFKSHSDTKEDDQSGEDEYPVAYDVDYKEEDFGEPLWKKYIKEKDRPNMRLPIASWLPSLPLLGKKVDTIYYCRKELARLNVEVEQDQQHSERFPVMNSAFVQFNHQVAAHMACQAVSHHIPKQMAPRLVEISPDDVLWGNMSVRWWENYIRTAVVVAIVVGMIIGWAFPVTFTGLLSQVNYLKTTFSFLAWLGRAPAWIIAIIQGILPQVLLGILLLVLPMILRLLAKNQGVQTGMAVELTCQDYYFAFLFVQVFLVVSISSGITTVLKDLTGNPTSVPSLLAENLPRASNYFFSYMLLQALSVSSGALLQIFSLVIWFLWAPFMDNTARQKWARQTNLPQMQWGTFYPVYTNLAVIGLVYSIISPLIMIFNIITFALFWITYRYNTLYVTVFRFDTGGLLFPKAINQLFTGLYVMELCLIGLFFLVRNPDGNGVPCQGQGIIMIIVFVFTIIYQYLLNQAFSPLFRYLPITLEDDAVIRDEEFARAQQKRFKIAEEERDGDDLNKVLVDRERRSEEEDRNIESIEMKDFEAKKTPSSSRGRLDPRNIHHLLPSKTWADRTRNHRSGLLSRELHLPSSSDHNPHASSHSPNPNSDPERQPTEESLYAGLADEIEDLTPAERDKLVQRAFQHAALRAKRPVIWIPRDELGVSDDEIYRTQRFSKHIWVSNEYTGLDGKARVVYRRSPPDFSEVDLIQL